MPGRLLHTLIHTLAAVVYVILAAGAAALAALAVRRPPPYAEWVIEGPSGALAAVTLLAGTVLWGLLAVTLMIWAVRCVRRAFAADGTSSVADTAGRKPRAGGGARTV